jgi:hypothetical protein
VPLGTDTACTVVGDSGTEVLITYWDLWYALVATDQFEGSLEGLAAHFREERARAFCSRERAIGKLSHLRDLQQRLRQAGVAVSAIPEAAGSELVKMEKRRAAGRILKHNERQYERSTAMQCPPQDRLFPAVLRVHWPRFPVSPAPYADSLSDRFDWERFYGLNASFRLARKLDDETDRAQELLAEGAVADALAMLRSLMTVTVELFDIADDSCGAIGDSFQAAFKLYRRLKWRESGIEPEVFLHDLIDFLIWDDYALTAQQTDGFFRSLRADEVEICLAHLRSRRAEYMALDLDYQADEALTLMGQVVAEKQRFGLFEELAAEMAADRWPRIILLADVAVKAGKTDLAQTVFEAALTRGSHLDLLRRKYQQLLTDDWDPDPRYNGRS